MVSEYRIFPSGWQDQKYNSYRRTRQCFDQFVYHARNKLSVKIEFEFETDCSTVVNIETLV